jgi:hypothetical protein
MTLIKSEVPGVEYISVYPALVHILKRGTTLRWSELPQKCGAARTKVKAFKT